MSLFPIFSRINDLKLKFNKKLQHFTMEPRLQYKMATQTVQKSPTVSALCIEFIPISADSLGIEVVRSVTLFITAIRLNVPVGLNNLPLPLLFLHATVLLCKSMNLA